MIKIFIEVIRLTRSARFLGAAVLGAAAIASTSTTATAQQGNAYGLNRPATVSELPAGAFRSALEGLPAQARGRALGILKRGEFTDGDLPYLRVDRRGDVFFEDPELAVDEIDGDTGAVSPPAEITQVDAFNLHSRPGAPKTVYIDFDGHLVTGTIWNSESGFTSHPLKPYDSNSSPSTWSAAELNVVADVWRRMAEDLAPYNVDVTTQEPAVYNSNVGHIVVTYKADENGNPIYSCSCGGVAYYGGFGDNFLSPGLVFIDGVGTGAHNISEAATHELGHNLYLAHDGTSTLGYYTGHGPVPVDWAPIMGVGYSRNVTQWSKGEYSGANNSEDDLQKITVYIPYRTDDHEDISLPSATPLVVTDGINVVAQGRVGDPSEADMANKGIIEDRTDIDLFSLDVGTGQIDLTITPGYFEEFSTVGPYGMNLDIEVMLLDDLGNVLQVSNPDLETTAQIFYDVQVAGRYYLEISGVGRGAPLGDGYSDYASIGQYYISGTVPPDVVSAQPPTAPDDLIATQADDTNIDLDWSDPISTAETNEAGYRVMRAMNGGGFVQIANLPRDSQGYSDNNLANGDYVYKLELYNGAGTSETATTPTITVDAPVVAVATSEASTAGSVVSGSYLSTQDPAGAEQLRERQSGGKPANRVSSLDHRWTISGVVPAAVVELYLHASAPANGDDEDFDFTYSINGGAAQPIGTAINGAAAQEWTVALPNDTAGNVVVRAVDTDRTRGNAGTDSVVVYEMRVTSAGSPADQPPVVSISEPLDGTTVVTGTEIVFSATVTDEDMNLDPSIAWSSNIQGPLGSSASVAATLLDAGTHVVTASVTDSAGQPGADTVSVTVLPADVTAPTIAVLGDNPASVTVGDTYVDAGATATDLVDGAVSVNTSGQGFTTAAPGTHTVTYTASDASGNVSQATRTVNVVEASALLTVPEVNPNAINRASLPGGVALTISGSGFTGIPTVTFLNGSGPTPSASNVTVVDGGALTATISGSSGGPRKVRVWDVLLTLPSGTSATCTGCLTINP